MSNIAGVIGGALNPHEYDTTDNSAPVPPGEYAMLIEKAELRDTKSGTGKYVWTQSVVTGPTHAGKKVFGNFNILNSSSEAQRIGRADLAKLAVAVGLPAVQDTSELIGKAFVARIKVKDNDNEIAGYKPIGGNAPQQSYPQQQAAQPAQASATNTAAAAPAKKKMPWEK